MKEYTPQFVFAGIGSRKTPVDKQKLLGTITRRLSAMGGQCRSGNAAGADWICQFGVSTTIKEKGVDPRANQIFLPWAGFNSDLFPNCHGEYHSSYSKSQIAKATEIISVVHPAWNRLSAGAKKLQTRNVFQVCGLEVDDLADFVVCWTPDGAEHHSRVTKDTGGTGTAIKIASLNDVPVFNIANEDATTRLATFVKTLVKE